ncbi:MAG: thioredoxin-disulfide reductase [Candidatus Bathyarchaeota archaeon]|nr:thioredoxin-disulfide reductase [Candidatus Bathyarchaeota archaeon]
MESWELIIIGAGAAGLAAGIYAARSGLQTLIIDEKLAGGTAADAPVVENYPGFSQIAGGELARKMTLHCKKAGATIHEIESVTDLDLTGERKIVKTSRAAYEANAVIIATGSHYREIGVKGEKEFRGKGVSYCGVCDGPFFKGKRVLVIGGGNSAATTTLYLSGIASEVVVTHRRDAFRAEEALVKDIASKKNVQVLWNTEVREIKGDKLVAEVVLYDNKAEATKEITVDAVFVQIGEAPNSQIAREAGIDVNEHGYIKTDVFQRTSIPGIYTAGDVTSHPVKQVGTAVGQGITAALEAYGYIRRPYYRR